MTQVWKELLLDPGLKTVPRWVGSHAERAIAARGDATRLQKVLERSSVPMVVVDNERRYVEVNTPARLAFRLSLAELRRLGIDDLTPEYLLPVMENAWARLMDTGCVAGPYEVAAPEASHLLITYYAVANVLPGQHLIAFSPADWPDDELLGGDGEVAQATELPTLSPREIEVLKLAADGCNGPKIAGELCVSAATIRTHFEHIYAKLGVRDRAGAVARAMRLGVIE